MNQWLIRASWWQRAVVMGVPPAIAVALVQGFRDGEAWWSAALSGLIMGLVVGPVLGAMLGRQLRRQLDAVGDVPEGVRARVAGRATVRGPVPDDPDERAATVRLIDHQLAEIGRRRTFSFVVQAAFALAVVLLAVASSPWWWTALVANLGLFVLSLTVPGRLERRRAELLRA